MKNETQVVRRSDREIVATRTINGPVEIVFDAWAKPELFKKWWVPKSAPMTLSSCEMDVRTGGTYRLVFSAGGQTMAFFGKYLEVKRPLRIVWTNEEGGPEAASVTTVTFEGRGDSTLVTVAEVYPSKAAADEAIESGATGALPEQLAQLEELIVGG